MNQDQVLKKLEKMADGEELTLTQGLDTIIFKKMAKAVPVCSSEEDHEWEEVRPENGVRCVACTKCKNGRVLGDGYCLREGKITRL